MTPGQAQQPPDTGGQGAICTLGQDRSAGCERIRAREIVDASAPPWSAIGRLNFASTDIRSHCTATLVSDRIAVTAAHCLYNAARKRRIPDASLRFVAGYQRGTGLATARVTRSVLAPGTDRGGAGFTLDPLDDWAVLILDEPLGARLGTVALAALVPPPPETGSAILPGYAGLRPHVLSVARDCGRPVRANGRLVAACSAMPGDSGAPLLWQGPQGLTLLGVTSAVRGGAPGPIAVFVETARFRDAVAVEIASGN